MDGTQGLSCGKTCPALIQAREEAIFGKSSTKLSKSKMKGFLFLCLKAESGCRPARSWATVFPSCSGASTRNFGESPRDAAAVTLSRILLADVPEKYYLSQKACQGILRRASARGKELPLMLKDALVKQAAPS